MDENAATGPLSCVVCCVLVRVKDINFEDRQSIICASTIGQTR